MRAAELDACSKCMLLMGNWLIRMRGGDSLCGAVPLCALARARVSQHMGDRCALGLRCRPLRPSAHHGRDGTAL